MLDFKKQITQGGQLISFKLERYIEKRGRARVERDKEKEWEMWWDGMVGLERWGDSTYISYFYTTTIMLSDKFRCAVKYGLFKMKIESYLYH